MGQRSGRAAIWLRVCWPAATRERLALVTAKTSKADAESAPDLENFACSLQVVALSRSQQVDLVLDREDRRVSRKQREGRVAAGTVGDRTRRPGVEVPVLLGPLEAAGENDMPPVARATSYRLL